jgi:hypothetical protein
VRGGVGHEAVTLGGIAGVRRGEALAELGILGGSAVRLPNSSCSLEATDPADR